jgi:hypothetical protein
VDEREQRRVDREHQVALHQREAVEEAVVHEHPVLITERMAVRLLDGRPCGGPDVPEEQRAGDGVRQLPQVLVVPRGLDAVEQRRHAACRGPLGVPAEAEAVAVDRLHAEWGVERLGDQRVLGVQDERGGLERLPRIREPTAHDDSSRIETARP